MMNRRALFKLLAGVPLAAIMPRASSFIGVDLAPSLDRTAVIHVDMRGALIDEWHTHRGRQIYDAIQKQIAARKVPL